jgi:hypothetical protein
VTVGVLAQVRRADRGEVRLLVAEAPGYELELRARRRAGGIAAGRRRQAERTMLPGKKRIG